VPRGTEIDPALSALVGQPVTVAGVPGSAAGRAPSLAEFAPGAGVANVTDLGDHRTLLPETGRLAINGTVNRTIFSDIGATLNARYENSTSRSLFGLPSGALSIAAESPFSPFGEDVLLYRYLEAAGTLTRESETDTSHLGMILDSFVGAWRWSLTGNYDRTDTRFRTDTGVDLTGVQLELDAGDPALNPFGNFPGELVVSRARDRARSINQTANAELVVNGTVRELAAGPLSTTFQAAVETRAFGSETFRGGVDDQRELSRDRAAAQVNVDLPIVSRRREARTWLGDLTTNFNLAVDQLSDFGTLRTIGGGFNWSPKEAITFIASLTDEDGAPNVQQLGDPVLITPNVPVFDFTRGETVEVTQVDGGNPDLIADNRRVLKLGARFKPFQERDLTLTPTTRPREPST
jgi:hypothetical protein